MIVYIKGIGEVELQIDKGISILHYLDVHVADKYLDVAIKKLRSLLV